MRHDISDGLTGDEAREVCACLLVAVEKHDRRSDTQVLLRDLITAVELAEQLAHGAPDDTAWPQYGAVEPINGSREVAR